MRSPDNRIECKYTTVSIQTQKSYAHLSLRSQVMAFIYVLVKPRYGNKNT